MASRSSRRHSTRLLGSIEKKREGVLKSALDRMSYRLPASLDEEVKATLKDWRTGGKVRRLWARDASLWTGHDENRWLDWLDVVDGERDSRPCAGDVRRRGAARLHVCGRAGDGWLESLSRCPGAHVRPRPRLSRAPGPRLDRSRADPRDGGAHRSLRRRSSSFRASPARRSSPIFSRTISSIALATSWATADAAKHFIAVTDPGSALQKVAEAQNFRQVFFGVPGIGGRYSALSNFGMVPAAVMGLDVRALPRACCDHGARVRIVRSARAKPGSPARRHSGDVGQSGP